MQTIFDRQKKFFATGKTRDLAFRREQLLRLEALIRKNEAPLMEALRRDLGKCVFEAYISEVGYVLREIRHTLKALKSWAKPRRVSSPWFSAPAASYIYSEPKGVVLIIGPWNYPFQLVISPLVGALAAGNCAVVKPSELSPHTSAAIEKMLKEMEPGLVACMTGDASVSQRLLELPWDHIFFTGGTRIGKVVMAAAAKHLTPVTLELGGKSPCIVDENTDLDVTARRITWGKFFNAGQTCVAPDYLLVAEGVRDALLERIRRMVKDFFGNDPSRSPDYGRIIHDRHFDRLTGFLDQGRVVIGGEHKKAERYLAPTVISDVRPEHRIMEDEIFGPLLPVLTYRNLDEAISFVTARPKPLALYVFSHRREFQREILQRTSFGGGCINDTLVHLGNSKLPFGGIGPSGMGAYHGRYSFDVFSHQKGVMKRGFFPDIKLLYPPYGTRLRWLRRFI